MIIISIIIKIICHKKMTSPAIIYIVRIYKWVPIGMKPSQLLVFALL